MHYIFELRWALQLYTHAPPATINVGLRSTVLKASIYLKPVSEILKGLQRLRPLKNVLVDRRTRIYCWHACASSHDECLSRAPAQHCIEGRHVLQVGQKRPATLQATVKCVGGPQNTNIFLTRTWGCGQSVTLVPRRVWTNCTSVCSDLYAIVYPKEVEASSFKLEVCHSVCLKCWYSSKLM